MLGTITKFSKLTTSGAIRSEQGVNFDFDLAGVLTYDVAALAEGKFVHFQAAGRVSLQSQNVSLEAPPPFTPAQIDYKEITQLRYVGFRHLEDSGTSALNASRPAHPPSASRWRRAWHYSTRCASPFRKGRPSVCA